MATIVVAVAAVASVAVSVVSLAMQDGGGPNMGSAPAPANYYEYDEDGNVTSSQTWNEDKHAFEHRTNPAPDKPAWRYIGTSPDEEQSIWDRVNREIPMVSSDDVNHNAIEDSREALFKEYQNRIVQPRTDEAYQSALKDWEVKHAEWQKGSDARKKDKQLRTEIRTKMLENLNQTPEDRVAAYEQYAKTFSESMQENVTEQYQKAKQSQEEKMTATGMMGSRAYADTMGEMEKEKLKADVDIAAKGEMAKHELGNIDRNYWLNVLGQLDAGGRADAVVGVQKAQAANQAAIGGTATLMGRYAAESQNQWNKWNADMARQQGIANTVNNAAGGLMYLYGYAGRGGGITPARTTTPNSGTGVGMYGLYA